MTCSQQILGFYPLELTQGICQRAFDHHLYKERNLVERFINRIKQYRRVATRYEKTARNFLAFVQVAAITVLLL